MYKPRKYQTLGKTMVSDAFASLNKLIRAVILCVPTGGGKTVMFADMVKEAMQNGVPVLVLCNRKELIKQAKKKLNDNGLYPTLIIPGYKHTESILYLGSVDTLRNHQLPDVGFVVIDECHIRDFDEVVLEYKLRGAYIVGCTATPTRTGKRFLKELSYLATHYPGYTGQLGDVYDCIVSPTTITELLNGDETGETFLVPAITYGAEVSTKGIRKTNTKDGIEFNQKDVEKIFNTPKMYGGVVDKYLQLTPGTKAICYCSNRKASIHQCAEFNARGIKAVHIDGSTKNRDKLFEAFERGEYMILCNVRVATTGNDMPTVETIIVNLMTMSLGLWIQMTGRGGRLCPEIGKTHFNIIDMGGNVYRHGFWQQERDWSLDIDYISKCVGVAPIRECQQCEALIGMSVAKCPYCDMVQEKRQRDEQKLAQAEFVVLDNESIPKELKKPLHQMTVTELERFRELKEYSLGWIVRQLLTRDRHQIIEYAMIKNYSQAWINRQIRVAEEGRENVKNQIWEFLQQNKHLSTDMITDYAYKKLKANHSKKEIEELMPKILQSV